MKRKAISVFLVLAAWLLGTLACFCCEAPPAGDLHVTISACCDGTEHPASERGCTDCTHCCGHQVFAPAESKTKHSSDSPKENLGVATALVTEQLHPLSIYHPPKA